MCFRGWQRAILHIFETIKSTEFAVKGVVQESVHRHTSDRALPIDRRDDRLKQTTTYVSRMAWIPICCVGFKARNEKAESRLTRSEASRQYGWISMKNSRWSRLSERCGGDDVGAVNGEKSSESSTDLCVTRYCVTAWLTVRRWICNPLKVSTSVMPKHIRILLSSIYYDQLFQTQHWGLRGLNDRPETDQQRSHNQILPFRSSDKDFHQVEVEDNRRCWRRARNEALQELRNVI